MLEAIIGGGRKPLTTDDYTITQVVSGQDVLRFTLSRQDPVTQLLEERTVLYETTTAQRFWISGIDAGQKKVTYQGQKDLGDWQREVLVGYTNGSGKATVRDTIQGVLPQGWSVSFQEEDGLAAYITLQGPTPLEVVEHCLEVYGCGAVFDNHKKILTIHLPGKKTLGTGFLVDTANLRAAPEYKGKATELVTRLYAQGGEGATFADINGGKPYVECYDYTDRVICGYWRDERYTVPEHLLAAAREKVKALAQPERQWTLSVCDLHAIDPKAWPGLELELFQVVQLVDLTRGTRMQAQIVEKTLCPHHPERNEIQVSLVAGTLGSTYAKLLRRRRLGELYQGLELSVDHVKETVSRLEGSLEGAMPETMTGTVSLNGSGATVISGMSNLVEKCGNAVTMQLAVALNSALASGYESLAATLPAGFRPQRTVGQTAYTRGGVSVEVRAYANGQVTVRPAEALGTQNQLLCNMSWYTG